MPHDCSLPVLGIFDNIKTLKTSQVFISRMNYEKGSELLQTIRCLHDWVVIQTSFTGNVNFTSNIGFYLVQHKPPLDTVTKLCIYIKFLFGRPTVRNANNMEYCKQTHTYSMLAKIKKKHLQLALKFKYIYIILLKLSVNFLLISVVMLVSMATTLLLSAYHKDYQLFLQRKILLPHVKTS